MKFSLKSVFLLSILICAIYPTNVFSKSLSDTKYVISKQNKVTGEIIDHSLFSDVLTKYVHHSTFRYRALKSDTEYSNKLDTYLKRVATASLNNSKNTYELAFWINAYNAYTIQLVLNNYPVKSIKEINNGVLGSPWNIKFAEVAGQTYTLNNIEHDIIRPYFSEPLVHFALNCASVSCPGLRNSAYLGDSLSEQLDRQAELFMRDLSNNYYEVVETGFFIKEQQLQLHLSEIFSWFKNDFSHFPKGLNGFLMKYIPNVYRTYLQNGKYSIKYRKYNWSLNGS